MAARWYFEILHITTTRNSRIFEVAKELVKAGKDVGYAIGLATKLVDEIGIETE